MKRHGTFILALLLVFSLSACGKGGGADNNTPGTNTSDTSVKDTNSANTDNTTSSVTDDFLKTITAETAEAKGVCGADLTWYYQDGVLVIKGTGPMTDFGINVKTGQENPWGEHSGSDVYKKVQWVIIDEGVTSIGRNAFGNCESLSNIKLPNTLERIEDSTFEGCYNIKSITIPASVTYIGNYNDNDNLETITFLGDAPEGTLGFVCYANTIYYSGSGFDELIAEFPDINWVKQ